MIMAVPEKNQIVVPGNRSGVIEQLLEGVRHSSGEVIRRQTHLLNVLDGVTRGPARDFPGGMISFGIHSFSRPNLAVVIHDAIQKPFSKYLRSSLRLSTRWRACWS